MLSYEKTVQMYAWIRERLGLPQELMLGVPSVVQTEGYSVGAIIDAGYNIGWTARRDCGAVPTDGQYEEYYARLLSQHQENVAYAQGQEGFDFPFDADRALTEFKDLVLRVAKELWGLFPEIYMTFGQEYPDVAPDIFFGQHTKGRIFLRANLFC